MNNEVRAALEALRDEYAEALPGAVDELRTALAEARSLPEAGLVEHARSLAHRLHGAAGSFGFHEASRAAGRIERALDQAPAIDWAAIDLALDALSPDGPASRPDPLWPT